MIYVHYANESLKAEIRQFAGHSSITVTERYTRFRPYTVRDHILCALG